jgi:hypothetical protein
MSKKDNNEISGWTGWIGFAWVMLCLAGFFHIIAGLAALVNDKVYVISESNLWTLDYTRWGWIHIIGGLLALWAASSLIKGNAFGRTVAVIVALGSAVLNMMFIPIYPLWAILIITINILVIYAVLVHGGELKD